MIASKQQKKVEHFSDSTQQNEDVDIFAGLTLPVAPSHNIVINQPPQSASDEERISYSPNIDSQIQKSTIEAVSNDIQNNSNNSESVEPNLLIHLDEDQAVDNFAIFSASVNKTNLPKSKSNTAENEISEDTTSNLPTQLSNLYTTVEDGHYS